MSATIVAQTLRDSDYGDWGKLVTASPVGSIYATAAYLENLCPGAADFASLGLDVEINSWAEYISSRRHPTDAALNSATHFKSQLGGDLVTNVVVEMRGTAAWPTGSALGGAHSGLGRRARGVVRRLGSSDSK